MTAKTKVPAWFTEWNELVKNRAHSRHIEDYKLYKVFLLSRVGFGWGLTTSEAGMYYGNKDDREDYGIKAVKKRTEYALEHKEELIRAILDDNWVVQEAKEQKYLWALKGFNDNRYLVRHKDILEFCTMTDSMFYHDYYYTESELKKMLNEYGSEDLFNALEKEPVE